LGDEESKFNKELCEERHKNITNDIKSLKDKMWWFVTFAVSSLVVMILNFIKDIWVK